MLPTWQYFCLLAVEIHSEKHKFPKQVKETATHLFGLYHLAVLLQAANLPLQQDVGLLQVADFFNELADVLQVTKA